MTDKVKNGESPNPEVSTPEETGDSGPAVARLPSRSNDGQAVDAFVAAVARQIEQTMRGNDEEYREVRAILDALEAEASPDVPLTPQSMPVVRFWSQALDATRRGAANGLAGALEELTPRLRWMQCPNYTVENTSQGFMDNYAYTELIGPDGFRLSDTVSIGIMLLGPNTYYPSHTHPTVECLYMLSGRGTWHLSGGPTISLPPGSAVFIPYGSNHAFWSMEEPLAAIYFCAGDVNYRPVLSRNGAA